MRGPWSFGAVLCVVLFAVGGLLPSGSVEARPSSCRLALLIAHNHSGGRAKRLYYAVSDANKVKTTLHQVGGYPLTNITVIANQNAAYVRKVFQQTKRTIRRMQRNGCKVTLFVYYAGHARNGRFFLGASTLSFAELRRFLKRSKAELRLAFLDTCGSGQFLRQRGLVREKSSFRIPALNTHVARGEAIITSTGTRQNAYEDLQLRGGIFTHFMNIGLRGAADQNGDGRVTLNELYTYAYNWTLNRTVFASSGPQKPHFQNHLQGAGQIVLSATQTIRTQLYFARQLQGQFFIWNAGQALYAGFRKKPGKVLKLAMAPGAYIVQWRHNKKIFTTKIKLRRQEVFHLKQKKKGLAFALKPFNSRGQNDPSSHTRWRSLEEEPTLDTWQLALQLGAQSAQLVGGLLWGGGSIGLRHRFFALRLGIWGTITPFQLQTTQHLQISARFDGGYGHQWGPLSLFVGGFAGASLLVQDLNASPYIGGVLKTGVTVVPAWSFSRSWSLALPLDAGVEGAQLGEKWRGYFLWTAGLELRYAF